MNLSRSFAFVLLSFIFGFTNIVAQNIQTFKSQGAEIIKEEDGSLTFKVKKGDELAMAAIPVNGEKVALVQADVKIGASEENNQGYKYLWGDVGVLFGCEKFGFTKPYNSVFNNKKLNAVRLHADTERLTLRGIKAFFAGPKFKPGKWYTIKIMFWDKIIRFYYMEKGTEKDFVCYQRKRPEIFHGTNGWFFVGLREYHRKMKGPEEIAFHVKNMIVKNRDEANLPPQPEILDVPKGKELERLSSEKKKASQKDKIRVILYPNQLGWDEEKIACVAEISDILNCWTTNQYKSLDKKVFDDLKGFGLQASLGIKTHQFSGLKELQDKPYFYIQNPYARLTKNKKVTNPLCPAYIKMATLESYRYIKNLPPYKIPAIVHLNTETMGIISYDDNTRRLVYSAGILPEGTPLPQMGGKWGDELTEAPSGKIIPDNDPGYKFAKWVVSDAGYMPMHRAIASKIKEINKNIKISTDPLSFDRYTFGRFKNLDVILDWVRVDYAGQDPKDIMLACERAWAHRRRHGQEISIGPQLGGGYGDTALPHGLLTEACWLSVASGSEYITHWGIDLVVNKYSMAFQPGGKSPWEALKKLQKDLYQRYGKTVYGWKPVKRKAAMWLSFCDEVYTKRSGLKSNVKALFYSIIASHLPCDIIYDDDVLEDKLSDYSVLFIPHLDVATQSMVKKLNYFTASGGQIIACSDFNMPEIKNVYKLKNSTAVHLKPWFKKQGEYLSHEEFRERIKTVSDEILNILKVKPEVTVDRKDIIINLMQKDGKKYLILVNDRRGHGKWSEEVKYPNQEEALPVDGEVTIHTRSPVTDLETGKQIKTENGTFKIHLEPGWGKILEYRDENI